ncbi:hypothetical protein MIR68_012166 [Amoeboaphelidium protococcarum]|nr:hypothetical protein MIR68_012166 [Amoeboaphelidium protococcarum]
MFKYSNICLSIIIGNLQLATVSALDSLTISGNRFVDSSGNAFVVRGLAYQPTANGQFKDVIHNDARSVWGQDIDYFKELNVNVLRVYETDPTLDHSEFMRALESIGVCVLFDLPSSQNSINRKDPSYSLQLSEMMKSKIDNLAKYSNTMGFIIGNEVANQAGGNTSLADAFVKTSLVDMKRHIKQMGYRAIPFGYAAADIVEIRREEMQYFCCDDRSSDYNVDFYGLNSYSYCGSESDFAKAGYDQLVDIFSVPGVPVLFTEFGCNVVQPRTFSEVPAIYSDEMMAVFSGGIVYEYTQETNGYGLVEKAEDGAVSKLPDFDNYLSEMNKVSFNVPQVKFSASESCTLPLVNEHWILSSSEVPPVPQLEVCECLSQSSQCTYNGNSDSLVDALNLVCGLLIQRGSDCDEITPVTDDGSFGDFAYCAVSNKVNFALNKLSKSGGKCDVPGSSVQKPAQSESQCQEMAYQSSGHNLFTSGYCEELLILIVVIFVLV